MPTEAAPVAPTVAEAVVALLAEAGVRRYYTVPGESFLGLLDAVEQDERLRLISTRHESGASFMAEADARMTGVPAVAMGSRGPGAANLSIGVHTAHYDGTPMIVLLGQVESENIGRGAFQEVDLTAFFAPITKWSATASTVEEVAGLVAQGLEIATTGRPGPVAISVPADFWEAPAPAAPPAVPTAEPEVPGPAELDVIAATLAAASSPVAIVGGGAVRARDEVVALADHLGIGVYTAFRRQDAFPFDHPNYLGHLGLGSPPATLEAVRGADVLLVLGARFDEVTSQTFELPRDGQTVLRVGGDASRAGSATGNAVAAALRGLIERAPGTARDLSGPHAAAVALAELPEVPDGTVGTHPAHVIAAVQRALPDDAVVSNDAGNFAGFYHRYWRFTGGVTQLGPANGAMGYAVPAAVGAALAAPDRTALAIVGDGGVMMTGTELETAARYGAKVIVLVLQNTLYGTIAMHQAKTFGRMAGTDIGLVDIATWATGLGATGIAVERPEQLDEAIQRALAAPGPAVIAVRTDPDIISPVARLSDLAAQTAGGSR
ncbi:MAG: thiamine pyrophosphate-binding protein [Streptosporangiales bacterium]|nr:thiamine pyrophosphate-binding protein [Streptosporangiales bacterium]